MLHTSIRLSELYRHLRIDAEFYKPEYLAIKATLDLKSNLKPLRVFCSQIKKGIFDISPDLYTDIGVPLIRTSEIKNPLICFSTTVFLDAETHKLHSKTELKPNDIVMTKIGAYIGDIAILPESYKNYNFSQNVTGLSIKKSVINPKYLFAYLLSKYGHTQIKRITMLSGQGKIELEDIRDISVYDAFKPFQELIADVVKNGQSFVERSESKIKEAEGLLLNEIGLSSWKPEHKTNFIKNYSFTKEAGRLDAEYYQPKYEVIEQAIRSYSGGYSEIRNEFKQNKSTFKVDEEKQYQYVEIGSVNVSDGEILPIEIIGSELPANAKRVLKKDDILISKVRTYRGAITIVEQDGYVGSGAFSVLRESGVVNKETLLAFLHSKPLLAWSLKPNTGTSYPVIVDEDILNLPIPLIPKALQLQIAQKIRDSFSLRTKSKQLIECAKRAVEVAIEQDEESAISWLKDQTSTLLEAGHVPDE